MRILTTALLALVLLLGPACGGGSSSTLKSGPLSGNWQLNLTQNFPAPPGQTLSVSGFLTQSGNTLTGSVQGPTIIQSSGSTNCGGIGQLTGTISSQNVSFSLNPGGTTFNFTGVISSDNTMMSGTYQALSGACFNKPTTGTWSANLIPPLNGTSFTGTFNSTSYMEALTGSNTAVPVPVSGSFTQSPNAGTSTATLTGTITAVGYPCFTTASLTGTISGTSIYLSLYGYNGVQIGTLGQIQKLDVAATPAMLTMTSGGLQLTGGLDVNIGSPCPALTNSAGAPLTTDSGTATLNVE